MNVDLEGKVILITGAASGIGAAIAHAAAEAGATGLVLTDKDPAGLAATIAALPAPIARPYVADLADPGAPQRLIDEALIRFGRIDGLVNAAGLTNRGGVTDGTLDLWDELFAVNSRAAFFLMQAAVRDMVQRGAPGTIVNILSIHSHCGAPDLAIYAATKAALSTLTKNTANAHLADNIRVNGINLGWVDTPSERHMQSVVLGRGDGWLAEEAGKMPLGKLIAPEDVARLATYLLSDASAPMTAAAIDLEQRVTGAPFGG